MIVRHGTLAALVLVFWLTVLVTPALAVEPISITIGVITTALGAIVSFFSLAITIIRYGFSWALFVLIFFGILAQFLAFLIELNITGILQNWFDESQTCEPIGPGSDRLGVLGNLGQQAKNSPGSFRNGA